MIFHCYLSWKLIDVLATFEKNGQPMMTIENGSVWSGFQGARLPGTKCEFDGFGWESAERFELHWMSQPKPSLRVGRLRRSVDRRQPPQQEKVMAAQRAAVRPQDPVDGLLHDVANAYASKIH